MTTISQCQLLYPKDNGSAMTHSRQSAGYKVLLVDHQQESSRNTAFLLRLAGYDVFAVTSLEEAINVLTVFCSTGDSPAVILIDNLKATTIHNETCRHLAEHCRNSKILMVNRGEWNHSPAGPGHRIITPRHILGEVRKTLLEQTLRNDVSDNFCRFHSHDRI